MGCATKADIVIGGSSGITDLGDAAKSRCSMLRLPRRRGQEELERFSAVTGQHRIAITKREVELRDLGKEGMVNQLSLTDQVAIQTYHYHRRLQHQQQHQQHRLKKPSASSQQSTPQCDQTSSSSAAVDIIILLLVLGACGFLFTPYFTYVCGEAIELLPQAFLLIAEVVYQAPLAYAGATLFMIAAVLATYEIYQYKARRCENPHCRGLRKATELDIQLETEQCVKSSPPIAEELPWNGGVELGQDQKELEAELRRMAPPNGRAVLIFRRPCGCPAARFEAWGSRKAVRRSKKWRGDRVSFPTLISRLRCVCDNIFQFTHLLVDYACGDSSRRKS